MPQQPSGQLRPFTDEEIELMHIETFDVRGQTHPTETREVDQSTMIRTFLCDWDSRYDVMELVLGNVDSWDDGGTLKITRLNPHTKYGRHHRNPSIIATKLEEMTGFGKCLGEDANGMPEYPSAKLRFFYEQVGWNFGTDDTIVASEYNRYVIPPREGESEAELTTMPGGIMQYIRETGTATPHGSPIPFGIGIVTPTQKRAWTWVRVPYACFIPDSPLHDRVYRGELTDTSGPFTRPYIGTVNSEDFHGYQAGTMLFEGVSEKLRRDVLGEGWVFDLTLRFSWRPQGWTNLPYFDTAGSSSANGVYFVGAGSTHYTPATLPDNYSIYDSRDHNLLFQVS